MNLKLLPLYFLLGGTVVTLTTYLGKLGKGTLAAFVALFPTVTVISVCTIYLGEGADRAAGFARGLLVLFPVWGIYALALWQLLPRLGLFLSLLIGILLYVGIAFAITRLVQN